MLHKKTKIVAGLVLATICIITGCGKTAAPESETISVPGTEEARETETVPGTEAAGETEMVPGTVHKVCLDPGHQGWNVDMSATEPNGPGSSEMKAKASTGTAGNFTGVSEFDLNLSIGLQLRDELKARGYEVVMTREDNDTAISNKERAELAASSGSEIFVRIHADGSDDTSINGAMTMVPSPQNPYVPQLYEESYRLGECIINAYCEATGMKNNGVNHFDNQTGINWSQIPVTIIEMGFMSNEQDDRNMQNPEYQKNMVKGIANGIDTYFAVPGTEKAGGTEMVPGTEVAGGTDMVPGTQSTAALDELKQEVEAYITEKAGPGEKWSVSLICCDSLAGFTIGGEKQQAASLIKLYIMGAVFENYDELVAASSKENIDQQLRYMITISDNDASNALTRMLGGGDDVKGRGVVNDFCAAHHFDMSNMGRMLLAPTTDGDNFTSTDDCAAYLLQAVTGTLTGSEHMIELLKAQERTGKIPAGVPAGTVTANKTGELADVENDAAIIYAPGGTYILTVMSENLTQPGVARDMITNISSTVYKYLNK